MGGAAKERMEAATVWGEGLVVSPPTDQITASVSSSVSIRGKEVNPPGSIWGGKKSVTTLMDMHHLHSNARFFFFFCLSIQLNGDERHLRQHRCA